MSEEKEIDIIYLLGKILTILKKGKYFIIIITLISLLFGFYNYYVLRNDYSISFVVGTSTVKTNELIFEMVNGLQKDVDAENLISLEKNLNLKPDEACKIKKISIDSLPNTNFVKINLVSNDTASLVYFKQKTISFISKQKFIENLFLTYKTNNQKLLHELNKKMDQWDSLQKMMLNPLSYNNKILSVSPYYKEYFDVLEKKIKIETSLNEIKEGEVIIEYTYYIEKVRNKLILKLLKYGCLGFIVSILLLLLRIFYKQINRYAK